MRPESEAFRTLLVCGQVFAIITLMYKKIGIVLILVSLFSVVGLSRAETEAQRRARLQAELAKVEAQIKEQEKLVHSLSGQRHSLERDIKLIDAQIRKSELAIKQRNYAIAKLQDEIKQLNSKLGNLDEKLEDGKDFLAVLLRKTYELDSYNLTELILAKNKINDVLQELNHLNDLKRSLKLRFKEITDTKENIEARKKKLEEKKAQERKLRELQALEKAKILKKKKEKAHILAITKGKESEYKKVLEYQRRTAADIRAALFSLRDTKGIKFGTAYKYAKEASAKTGVSPALILAILTQETNLGKNVGTGNWQLDMRPKDRPIFKKLMAELGFNPDKMPVSKKPWYGWGGAMGPAQFIPSTWVLYKDRIARVTGENPPNPWNPRTAFFATALLMKDNGADAGTRAAERLAALRYFAGWKNARKPAYAFYGDGVMEFRDKYQRQINILEGK